MAFIHVVTRKVFATTAICRPNATWMQEQAEALLDHAQREELGCSIVTRDRDGKFSPAFDRYFTDRGISVNSVGPQAPNLNALVERWIQSLKYVALDYCVAFILQHIDDIVSEYVAYYHECKPHQGIGKRLIGADEEGELLAVVSFDEIKCERKLGGVLKHYCRAACASPLAVRSLNDPRHHWAPDL